jgi:putative amide transporter protein
MTLVLLATIAMLWFPIGLFYLGQGDARTCGAIAGFVGVTTIVGGLIHATPAFGSDAFTATLLIPFGVVYCTISYCILAGVEDLRSLGNLCIMMTVILGIAAYFFFTGAGVKPDGTTFIGVSKFFGCAMTAFCVLTLTVWGVTYGKVSAKALGWLLIILSLVGLILPTYSLLGYGKLPF